MAVALTPAQVLARAQAKAKRETLEITLAQQLRSLRLVDGMRPQFEFHPNRKWRFDFCWPSAMLAMEVDGGTWTNGAHSRGSGQAKDCEKLAAAVILGYRVMRATTNQVKDGTAARWVESALAFERKCPRPRCGGTMLPGLAMAQTYGGAPDFPGGAVVTMSPSGPGKLTSCLKCSACGYSVSA